MTRSIRHSRLHSVATAAGVTTVALGLAACAPGSTTSSPGASAAPSSAVTTGFDSTAKVTITVSDGWGTTGTGATFGQVISAFEKKYPNVTVNRETTDYDSYQQSINLRGSSPNPPDVMMLETSGYGQGFYQFVRSGLVLPLDAYAKAYGWDKRFGAANSLDVFRFDRDKSSQWGSGALYGVPEQNSMMTVFYNKKLAGSIGLNAAPTTYAAFEQSLAAAKAKGVTPIAQSNSYIHLDMALWSSFVSDAKPVDDWIYGRDGATFASEASLKAATAIADWQNKGYFQEGVSGASYSDASGAFLNGSALYYVEGSWMTGAVESSLKGDGDAFQMPGATAGAMTPVGGGLSTPLTISSKSAHPDVAAAFLDYFISEQTSDFLYQNGWGIPGGAVSHGAAAGTSLTAKVLQILTPIQATGGAGSTPFLDWAAPNFTNDLPTYLQKMASGATPPNAFATQVQNDWTTFQQQRKAG